MNHRLKRFLKKIRLRCVIIKNLKNIRYLTGFTGTNGVLLIIDDSPTFLTDPRYSQRAEREVKTCRVRVVADPLMEAIKIVNKKRLRTIGVEFDSFTLREREDFSKHIKRLKLRDVSGMITRLRSVKTEEELKMIRKASHINRRIFETIIEKLKPEVAEIEIAKDIEMLMRNLGCDTPYFSPIVAVDPGSAIPHPFSGRRRLKAGRGVLFDFGSVWRGYSTDETVVVHVGKPNEYYKKIWTAVRDAKDYAISSIKPGIPLSEPERIVREYLGKKGLEKFFTHSLGHGIGLEVHEFPRLSLKSEGTIEEGMVFTVEPGVYIKGKFGIRLEDVVYVSSKGNEILTMIDKKEVFYV